MNSDKQIPVPPFWTSEDAYIVISFLNKIIDAIREAHGKRLAIQSPSTTAPSDDDCQPF
jgi:hypothetical protein